MAGAFLRIRDRTPSTPRHASILRPVGDCIDKCLILGFTGTLRDETGLSMGLLGETRRMDIWHPYLHGAHALGTHPRSVVGDPLSVGGHETSL